MQMCTVCIKAFKPIGNTNMCGVPACNTWYCNNCLGLMITATCPNDGCPQTIHICDSECYSIFPEISKIINEGCRIKGKCFHEGFK